MRNPLDAALELMPMPRRGAGSGARASIFGGAAGGRLYADWEAWTLSPDFETRQEFRRLRARARQLVRDNGWAAGFVEEVSKNVIGPLGIFLQGNVRNANGDLVRATNQAIEAGWSEWSNPETASADGHDSLIELERLMIEGIATDGECLVRRIRGADNPFGYMLQLIDPDLLDELYNVAASAGQNQIKMGVEVDRYNRPIAYHVWSRYGEDLTGAARVRQRIAASDMLHLFIRYRANQTRGITWFAPVLTKLRHLDGYEMNELVASRVAAGKMGFILNKQPDAIAGFEWDAAKRKTMDVAPGEIDELLPGQEFVEFDPTHPSGAYASFTLGALMAIARGLRVSYLTLTGDTSKTNYSSQRVALNPERDRWRALQVWFGMTAMRPIYHDWIDMSTLSGAVRVDSRLGSDFRSVIWKGRGWKWVDPFSDLKAAKLEIDLGLNSRQRLAAERGADFEEIVDELAYEIDYSTDAGVDVSGNQSGTNPLSVTPIGKAEDLEEPQDKVAEGESEGDETPAKPARPAALHFLPRRRREHA